MTASDPFRLIEHAGHDEIASRDVRVSFSPTDLELFGLLLGEKLNAIGNGHSERPVDGARLLVTEAADGWVGVLVVHGVEEGRVETVRVRVLATPPLNVDAPECLRQLVDVVRSAAKEARDKPLRPYAWSSIIAPRGPDSAVETRARLGLGGRYDWEALVLEPLTSPYEGSERLGWGLFSPYREFGIRAEGRIEAATGDFAQRAADTEVARVCRFLSLLFPTSIEPRQQMASIVRGPPDDLIGLFGKPDVDEGVGTYSSLAEGFAQTATEVPDAESDGKFRMPADAGELWSGTRAMGSERQTKVWNALGAYANAWRLKAKHPSLSVVSLVTAIEAIIDPNELSRCPTCNNVTGIGPAYRRTIARYTGAPERLIKQFTDVMYERRSETVHSGALFGGEDESMLRRGLGWTPHASIHFAWNEWPLLEQLTAATLITWLRNTVFESDPTALQKIVERYG